MSDVKLIMCDIDGTLLTDDHTIGEKTKAAIAKLRANGILFGIATGRSLVSMSRLIKQWSIDDYVDVLVGMNGSHMIDFVLDLEETNHQLDGAVVKQIIDEYSELDVNFTVIDGNTYYVNQRTIYTDRIANNNSFNQIETDFSEFFERSIFKMMICGDTEKILEIEAYYDAHPPVNYRGVRSTQQLFEFMDPQVSKSFGIDIIARNHGFNLQEVACFGDELNDIEMIRDCGYGICMGNGHAQIKELADFVTLSNNDDGIAYYIENYILNEA